MRLRPTSRFKPGMTVRRILADRLTENNQSSDDLAHAIEVPGRYVRDLIAGRRRAPLPARTDLYERMTRFLKLGRTDLAQCATAERAAAPAERGTPDPAVQAQMVKLCSEATAERLRLTGSQPEAKVLDFLTRVLAVAQGEVCRWLVNEVPLRLRAHRTGLGYPEIRLRVLEFLDRTPATLTDRDVIEFVLPQIAGWDVDDGGVLKVVLHPAATTERHQRRPLVRRRGGMG